jgi:hypothetical protein
VRASVGRPGASAHAETQRRRPAEWTAWRVTVPWRIAAVLAVGLAAWLLATQIAPHLAALAGVTVAAGLGWLLRFRVAPETVTWRRGAAGGAAHRPTADPWSGTVGQSCTTWPSRLQGQHRSPGDRPERGGRSTPSSIGGGCGWTPTGWFGTAATSSSRPCARPYGRRTKPTRSSTGQHQPTPRPFRRPRGGRRRPVIQADRPQVCRGRGRCERCIRD